MPETEVRDDAADNAMAGAFAGVAECVAVQPLDMVKTRFQVATGGERVGVYRALAELVREGGVTRLYRGLLPTMLGMAPKTSAMISAYEYTKVVLEPADGSPLPTRAVFAAGVASGLPEALSVTPFEVVKVRMQAQGQQGPFKSSMHCLRAMVRSEGLPAVYKGFAATCWRNCVWNSMYFTTIHVVRSRLPDDMGEGALMMANFWTGVGAGMFATCFNAPFDVVKSRTQAAPAGVRAPRVLPALARIAAEEGPRALYKGFWPKTLRMGLGGGVCWVAVEVAHAWLL